MRARTTILVIESNDARRAAIMAALDPDYAIAEAKALATGLRQAKAKSPDCVLLSMFLPDCEGIATYRHFMAALPDSTVIVVTGDSVSGQQAIREGAQDWIAPPFAVADVVRRVELAIARTAVRPYSRAFNLRFDSIVDMLEAKKEHDSKVLTHSPLMAAAT